MPARSTQKGFPKSKLSAIRILLERWRADPSAALRGLIAGPNLDDLLAKVEATLEAVRSARVVYFDPYLSSGYSPGENQLSDTIRAILDPGAWHSLGFLGLESLLDAVAAADPNRESEVEQLRAILRPNSQIRVHREFCFDTGRVDIRIEIFFLGKKAALIFIENKKNRGAVEIGEKPQTIRYEEVLSDERSKGTVGLGIYLTPDEKPAQSGSFVAVGHSRFADCLRLRLSSKFAVGREGDNWIPVYAFALTWPWMA
jgi:hypothetical protein